MLLCVCLCVCLFTFEFSKVAKDLNKFTIIDSSSWSRMMQVQFLSLLMLAFIFKVKVLTFYFISQISRKFNVTDITSTVACIDWHIYTWPWTVLKVRVKAVYSSIACIDRANITIAIKITSNIYYRTAFFACVRLRSNFYLFQNLQWQRITTTDLSRLTRLIVLLLLLYIYIYIYYIYSC